ncbi:uncharacterized protein LOC124172103 [Ischnura elegans]|uniref:uncharacterized protein LOC124172103 n=1 Tax=Ischnura elegans TaxID=197161 RepID=UPI001ED8B25A|nr:uncharacterized protein LOC124172103 [Ischnura elegans]
MWILDGGASDHMTNRKHLFINLRPLIGQVAVGDGYTLEVRGIATIKLEISSESGGCNIDFPDVLYMPDLKDNLFSKGELDKKGIRFSCYQGVNEISDEGEVYFKAFLINNLLHHYREGSHH